MTRRLDQILVIDVESTCWEDQPAHAADSEIIEIGLCLVDVAWLERIERRSILIKPVRSEVSAYCTRLTTLTADDLADAGTLADACRVLKKEYRSRERLWASWGDYDRRQFERVCQDFGVRYPFGSSHLNVKTLYAVAHHLPQALGMDAALAHAGLPLDGTHHRGVDDAWNIAALLCGLLRRARGEPPIAAAPA
jgi:inhibitor of KinA sporulation pathway (predicted exonuclease)